MQGVGALEAECTFVRFLLCSLWDVKVYIVCLIF